VEAVAALFQVWSPFDIYTPDPLSGFGRGREDEGREGMRNGKGKGKMERKCKVMVEGLEKGKEKRLCLKFRPGQPRALTRPIAGKNYNPT